MPACATPLSPAGSAGLAPNSLVHWEGFVSPIDGHRLYSLERAPRLPDGMATMMMPAELDVLYSIARNYCSGAGAIVDAGIFLGGSTACFAEGLSGNAAIAGGGASVAIHSYERAIVTKPMIAALRRTRVQVGSDFGKDGESYAPYLQKMLAKYSSVHLHVGDIMEAGFPEVPVEVLYLDILKSEKIQEHCNRIFLPRLIPGRSLIIQQDYFWYLGWFVNAFMERFRDYFELVDTADTSAVFRLIRALPQEAYEPQVFTGVRAHETLALLERARHKGETLAQYLMHELCVATFILQVMGAFFAEMRMKELEAKFGDLMIDQRNRADMKRATVAFAALRGRVNTIMASPNVRKILIN